MKRNFKEITLAFVKLGALCTMLAASLSSSAQQLMSTEPPGQSATLESVGGNSIWEHGVGEGFRCGAQSMTVSVGGAYGLKALESTQNHDLVLSGVTYGVMLDGPKGEGHWFKGNFELRVQLFGGAQVSPSHEYVVGLTPHLRYNLATGTRWVPFLDLGAGVTGTGIRKPDLGGPFQFNLQGGAGVERFLTDDVAVSVQAGYLHMSSAGFYEPNKGVNCLTGMIGVSFFF